MRRLILALIAAALMGQTPGKYGRWIAGVDSAARDAKRYYIAGKSTAYTVHLGIQDCQGNQIETSKWGTLPDAVSKAKEHAIMGCSGTIVMQPNHESGRAGVGAWRVE